MSHHLSLHTDNLVVDSCDEVDNILERLRALNFETTEIYTSPGFGDTEKVDISLIGNAPFHVSSQAFEYVRSLEDYATGPFKLIDDDSKAYTEWLGPDSREAEQDEITQDIVSLTGHLDAERIPPLIEKILEVQGRSPLEILTYIKP